MTFRIALRSFAAQPVRSAVLVCGFGTGIACMAGLLGVGEVIVEQSQECREQQSAIGTERKRMDSDTRHAKS